MTTWAEAMATGLHAPGSGFYAAGRGPGTDFRTSATFAPDLLADALVVLLGRLPAEVRRQVVEIGAGDGALLTALADRLPPAVALVGIEQRVRPLDLPARVVWSAELPPHIEGLLIAFEWLDTVPVDVVRDGRLLRVDPKGGETSGPVPSSEDDAWLARWWPDGDRREAGHRREIGHRRDRAWSDAVARLGAGVALAVDYGHLRDARPAAGSLTGYRSGRIVAPAPGGERDVTAAVAWDAVRAAALERRPDLTDLTLLTNQKAALAALGVRAGLPARSGGPSHADALRRASAARMLLDPAGLGAFGWLLHAVDVPAAVLRGL